MLAPRPPWPPSRDVAPHGCLRAAARLAGLSLTAACAGTTAAVPFRRAKPTAAEESDCAPPTFARRAGGEWHEGARYALEACGQRYTYECDDEGCERACDYVPVASTFSGEGPAEGEHGELAHHWALAEFDCHDVRQADRSGRPLHALRLRPRGGLRLRRRRRLRAAPRLSG
ncbi:MAG: hypothetical protein IPG81_06685 [Sandaracinaceae bacterium]|nr:hypothetical protein [Sandaracinaceae bacterium]